MVLFCVFVCPEIFPTEKAARVWFQHITVYEGLTDKKQEHEQKG